MYGDQWLLLLYFEFSSFVVVSTCKLTSFLSAIKFYRMAMQLVPDIEFKVNYNHPADADGDETH